MEIDDIKLNMPIINLHYKENINIAIQSIESIKRDEDGCIIYFNTVGISGPIITPIKVLESADFVIDYCERMGFHIKEISEE